MLFIEYTLCTEGRGSIDRSRWDELELFSVIISMIAIVKPKLCNGLWVSDQRKAVTPMTLKESADEAITGLRIHGPSFVHVAVTDVRLAGG